MHDIVFFELDYGHATPHTIIKGKLATKKRIMFLSGIFFKNYPGPNNGFKFIK